jgi:outer membrane beta-barrel protein
MILSLRSPFLFKTLAFALGLGIGAAAFASDKKPATPPATPAPSADKAEVEEKVNVDKIKERYWARGEDSQLGVVQNRLYSKAGKLEVAVFGGLLASDPFLSVKNYGGSFGYHFDEYLALKFVGWKSVSRTSNAYSTLQSSGKDTDLNHPKGYYGLEGQASLLYGKLSVVGKKIIYYDFHLLAGTGVTTTETGNNFTPSVGLGQQVYLSDHFSLLVDYRLMRYNEYLVQRTIPSRLGERVGPRSNTTHSLTLGISFLFGGK